MKENLNKQEDALDSLLKLAETPKAPDWFEARTVSRLRREREKGSSFFSFFDAMVLRYAGLAGVTAVLVLLGISGFPSGQNRSEETGVTVASEVQDEQFFAALDAFDSYVQQASEWNQEL